jgi:hypothetical protein
MSKTTPEQTNARVLEAFITLFNKRDYDAAVHTLLGSGRPAAFIPADIVRIEDGRPAEHWDVLQDEATQAESKSGLLMFGDQFSS